MWPLLLPRESRPGVAVTLARTGTRINVIGMRVVGAIRAAASSHTCRARDKSSALQAAEQYMPRKGPRRRVRLRENA